MKRRRRGQPLVTVEERFNDVSEARASRSPQAQLALIKNRRGDSLKETERLRKLIG